MTAAGHIAVPAATLVLMRERDGAPPELLIVERAAVMAFAGGALVFPGGRIDPGDYALAGAVEEDAARIAAIRETIEETGVAVGLVPAPDAAAVAALRAGLAAGGDFATLIADAGLALDLAALVAFARWRPDSPQRRHFDTRFFLAPAPVGAEPSPDGAETAAAFWMSAAEVLETVDRGEAQVIFPTRRNLERLARFATLSEAEADAELHPVVTIVPWWEDRAGERWLCIPEGCGYPVTAQRLVDVRRG